MGAQVLRGSTQPRPQATVAVVSQAPARLPAALPVKLVFLHRMAKLGSRASGECLRTFEGHGDSVLSAVFSPDVQEVRTASQDGTAKLWSRLSDWLGQHAGPRSRRTFNETLDVPDQLAL